MLSNNAQFHVNLNKFVDQVNSYETIVNGVSEHKKCDAETLDQLQNTYVQLNNSLEDIQWTVSVLDQEEHQQILLVAFQALATLSTSLASMQLISANTLATSDDPEIKEKCEREISTTQGLYQGTFANVMEATANKVNHSLGDGFLPSQIDLSEGAGIEINAADLTLASPMATQGSSNSFYNSFWNMSNYIGNNFVYSPGMYYNVIPKSVSNYIFTKSCNDEGRINDIHSLMLGHKLDTKLVPFENSGTIILDRHNEAILAPMQFSLDILRNEQFLLNEETLYQKIDKQGNFIGNPNDIARTLYGRFGKEGGERIMYLCNQAIMPHVLEHNYLPLLANQSFVKGIPADAIVLPLPASRSGSHFAVSDDQDTVKIEIKMLMALNSAEETSYSAHLVHKTIITVPFATLASTSLDQQDAVLTGIQVEDVTSQLILNNEPEARELLKKF